MTKPKTDYRRGRPGRPSYDWLAIYIRFEAIRRSFGLSVNDAAARTGLTLVTAKLPELTTRLKGETLRRHIQRFKQEHLKKAGPRTIQAIEKLILAEMELIRL
jgi:hypothetical protein